jgi:hypothetical protein
MTGFEITVLVVLFLILVAGITLAGKQMAIHGIVADVSADIQTLHAKLEHGIVEVVSGIQKNNDTLSVKNAANKQHTTSTTTRETAKLPDTER